MLRDVLGVLFNQQQGGNDNMCNVRTRATHEQQLVVVEIIRGEDDVYTFTVKDPLELLCSIRPRGASPDALRAWDECWGRTSSKGFRPAGTSLSDYRTMKTVEITPGQVERLR